MCARVESRSSTALLLFSRFHQEPNTFRFNLPSFLSEQQPDEAPKSFFPEVLGLNPLQVQYEKILSPQVESNG